MKIIRATVSDVPLIMDCARKFCEVLKWPLNCGHYESVWRNLISDGSGVIFLLMDGDHVCGGIGGAKRPDLLSGELIAVEMFWYVQSQYRGGLWAVRMLHAFERWAEDNKCKRSAMVIMAESMPEKLEEFYRRMGYCKFETMYHKVI